MRNVLAHVHTPRTPPGAVDIVVLYFFKAVLARLCAVPVFAVLKCPSVDAWCRMLEHSAHAPSAPHLRALFTGLSLFWVCRLGVLLYACAWRTSSQCLKALHCTRALYGLVVLYAVLAACNQGTRCRCPACCWCLMSATHETHTLAWSVGNKGLGSSSFLSCSSPMFVNTCTPPLPRPPLRATTVPVNCYASIVLHSYGSTTPDFVSSPWRHAFLCVFGVLVLCALFTGLSPF